MPLLKNDSRKVNDWQPQKVKVELSFRDGVEFGGGFAVGFLIIGSLVACAIGLFLPGLF
jgi:hypothetical protein